jgi:N-acetylglucosaminyldiphosphoundecaprenol N-acetyl-beta-D-mannosaminyltransferase
MRHATTEICGCPCQPFIDRAEATTLIERLLRDRTGGYTVAINAEKIVRYIEDPSFRPIVEKGVLPFPDGSGALLGMFVGHGIRSAKIDLPGIALEVANRNSYRVFLLGASREINREAARAVARDYKKLQIVGCLDGFVPEEDMLSAIGDANPNLVLVALGSPKQERFSAKATDILPGVLFVNCGGRFDVLAGRLKLAPAWIKAFHMEAPYRLLQEPGRWRRQLKILAFLRYLAKSLLGARL